MSESIAIVTGASSGIGKATALRLARDFGAVVLAARSGEKLGEVGEQVRASRARRVHDADQVRIEPARARHKLAWSTPFGLCAFAESGCQAKRVADQSRHHHREDPPFRLISSKSPVFSGIKPVDTVA